MLMRMESILWVICCFSSFFFSFFFFGGCLGVLQLGNESSFKMSSLAGNVIFQVFLECMEFFLNIFVEEILGTRSPSAQSFGTFGALGR